MGTGRYVWQLLRDQNTYFYICGDVCMANDVFAVLVEIAKREGGLSEDDAQAFFRDMKKGGRYLTDVWGIVLNAQEDQGEEEGLWRSDQGRSGLPALQNVTSLWLRRLIYRRRRQSLCPPVVAYVISLLFPSATPLHSPSSSPAAVVHCPQLPSLLYSFLPALGLCLLSIASSTRTPTTFFTCRPLVEEREKEKK